MIVDCRHKWQATRSRICFIIFKAKEMCDLHILERCMHQRQALHVEVACSSQLCPHLKTSVACLVLF